MPSRTGPRREAAGGYHPLGGRPRTGEGLCPPPGCVGSESGAGEQRRSLGCSRPGREAQPGSPDLQESDNVLGWGSSVPSPGLRVSVVREDRGVPEEVEDLIGSVRGAVRPKVCIGRVLLQHFGDLPLGLLVELTVGDRGDHPVPLGVPGKRGGRSDQHQERRDDSQRSPRPVHEPDLRVAP